MLLLVFDDLLHGVFLRIYFSAAFIFDYAYIIILLRNQNVWLRQIYVQIEIYLHFHDEENIMTYKFDADIELSHFAGYVL